MHGNVFFFTFSRSVIGPTLGGIVSQKYSFEGACMVRFIYLFTNFYPGLSLQY